YRCLGSSSSNTITPISTGICCWRAENRSAAGDWQIPRAPMGESLLSLYRTIGWSILTTKDQSRETVEQSSAGTQASTCRSRKILRVKVFDSRVGNGEPRRRSALPKEL